MIFNENVIRDNILKNTLFEEIIKASQKVSYVMMVYEKTGILAEELVVKENMLENLRERYQLRQQKLEKEKEALRHELKAKTFYKMTQKQALEGQMKILQQNCHYIREKKQILTDLKSKQLRLINQLEELEVYEKEADTQVERLELKAVYDKKIESEETETVKQLLMLVQAKKNQISKQSKMMAILNSEVEDKQKKIVILKQESSNIEVSTAQELPKLDNLTRETQKNEKQASEIKLKLSKLASKTFELTQSAKQSHLSVTNNESRSLQLAKRISELIQESNSLNEKVIKTREHVINLNTVKNNQKKLNQQLKLKVRQLMKITIEHSQFSSPN